MPTAIASESSTEVKDNRNQRRRERYLKDTYYRDNQKRMNHDYYEKNAKEICTNRKTQRKIAKKFQTRTVQIGDDFYEVFTVHEVCGELGITRLVYLERERNKLFPQPLRDGKNNRLFLREHINMLKDFCKSISPFLHCGVRTEEERMSIEELKKELYNKYNNILKKLKE